VTRQLYTAVTASGRKKHLPLNSAISLSQTAQNDSDDDEQTDGLINILPADESFNPEEYLIGRESMERLEEWIEQELSTFERQVLELRLTGLGYVEIAHVLNRDEKSTDNALQRIRNKLKKWKEQ
jgi:RNA polymerase sporulation-specific sigma factor